MKVTTWATSTTPGEKRQHWHGQHRGWNARPWDSNERPSIDVPMDTVYKIIRTEHAVHTIVLWLVVDMGPYRAIDAPTREDTLHVGPLWELIPMFLNYENML